MFLYYFRVFLVVTYFLLFSVMAVIFLIFMPFKPNSSRYVMKLWRPAYFLANIRVEPINAPTRSPDKPVIYIANHQDLLDIFMLTHVWPHNTFVVGKRSIIFIPFFGIAFWLAGNIFINRSDKEGAWALMDQLAMEMHDHHKNIYILPEGTRSRGRGLLPFKKGAFATAIKAGADIVPICASSSSKIDLHNWTPAKGYIEFLPPVSSEGYTLEQAGELAEHCHHLMKNKIAELDARIDKESGKT
ncbi:1-acyl-sn-glycerol-3-phosphate acyltransferase [BD1-7 clade bacterium]|uniref:1-acyl-sn-glycerol-3-phosphate acyltransferase n=1 Tax=BD1-7 clade bacterium TaxID=2029982 RepID=A0A5S9QUS3_9GAMM|nr:1-acyl-sn-glycerol-3-phosphate acyltransferase [BD1-7 clade bacterium]